MGAFVEKNNSGKAALAVCFVLALAVWAVFGQTLRHEFVNYDDNLYVYDQPMISKGITLEGMRWAITHQQEGNWHPLTSLSHMLDVELYGMNPGGHHLTNVLLHMATTLALFLVFRSMTGSLWRSAFIAAVFALHPLRAESVAWISERKDVLSGLFFMLTLGAYARYARRPFSIGRYVPVCVLFLLGLMTKPMLVTLPLVLLLLDIWPLGRTRIASPHQLSTENAQPLLRLVAEKIPLLLISALFCGIAVWAQDDADAVMQLETISLPWRAGNALCSYATYIRQTFLPTGLVVYYPHPGADLAVWRIAGSTLLLGLITLAALQQWKKRPYLPVGWLWYTGMLVPVIGIMQVGGQAHADRYTYLPQIGLCLMATWLIADGLASYRHRRAVFSIMSVVIMTALAAMAFMQTKRWHDSSSLWNHTLAHTKNNYTAHYNLGQFMADKKQNHAAIEQYQEALKVWPDSAKTHYSLGVMLGKTGEHQTAIEHFQTALNIMPDYAEAHNSLGAAWAREGKPDDAIEQFQIALRLKPAFADAHFNLGSTLAMLGRYDGALGHFQSALQINPTLFEAHFSMGDLFLMQGQIGQAMQQYQAALTLKPNFAEPMNNLAWLLATTPDTTLRDGKRAVELALSAVALSHGENSSYLDTLAAAYAEAGNYPEAVATARRALDATPDDVAADRIRGRLTLYEAGRPYHDQ